jgi:hypothetical protein
MMTLETNQTKAQEQIERDRKALYEKLMQERYGIPTRGDSIQENPQP